MESETLEAGTLMPAQQPQPNQTLEYVVRLKNPDENTHPKQYLFISSKKKRKIVRAGRRGGKTTSAAILAVLYFLKGKRVTYAAPTIEQVDSFWTEVVRSLAEPLQYGVFYKNETDKLIEWRQGGDDIPSAQIRAKTAWNADTLRGGWADLLILDEWQLMDELAWEEAGAPILTDKDGDAVFIYTPPSLRSKSVTKARDPRHASKMFKMAEQDMAKKDSRWLAVHFRSSDNPFISKSGLAELAQDMSALAFRQEMLAEDTDEVPGALWTREMIENTRIKSGVPPCAMRRIVVGVDPPGSKTNEAGIVAVGEGMDNELYILYDASKLGSPKSWATAAVELYYSQEADRLVGERNYGGDMVRATIEEVDENISYKDVNATRGKIIRAEPICAMFEKGKAHIVGEMPKLEDELCSYVKGETKSPNRLDAMVWAATEIVSGGSLGFIEWMKSGGAAALLSGAVGAAKKPKGESVGYGPTTVPAKASPGQVTKVADGPNLTSVDDQKPKCEQCQDVVLVVVGGGQLRCQACGHQQWPKGMKPNPPLGGRRIRLQ